MAFAKEGAAGIMIADINVDAAEATSKACIAAAIHPKFLSQALYVDVTSLQGVKNMVNKTSRILVERIDCCVNCKY